MDYESITNSQWRQGIAEYVRKERDREILSAKLFTEATYEELAERYNLSVEGVKKIKKRAQEIVARQIQKADR